MATKDDLARVVEHMATKDDLARVVEHMATKEDLAETEERLHDEIVSKTGGIMRLLDDELDKRKLLEVRVSRLEKSGAR